MNPTGGDGPSTRWWAPRRPGWLRNTLLAAGVGLAVGLTVLAVVAPLVPEKGGPSAGGPHPTPSDGLTSIVLPGVPSGMPTARPSGSASAKPAITPGSAGPAPSRRSNGLTARYTVGDKWEGGYEASIQIATMIPVTGWSAVLTLPPGVEVSTAWEAEFQQNGRTLTLSPKPWNDAISRGQSITIGFQASGNAQPTSCTVNGVTCSK